MVYEEIITVGLNPTIDRVMEVPGLAIGGHVKGRIRSLMPAGKAFNVSRAMAALGIPGRAMGFLGRESIGLFNLVAQVAGIPTEWTPIDARTRENLTLVDPIAGTATHIRDVGPVVTRDDLGRFAAQLTARSRHGVLIVFCGSLPPGVAPEDLARLIGACRDGCAAVAVDSSGVALRVAAACGLWLIKPNDEELAELVGRDLGGPDQVLSAARELARRFPVVLVTAGGDGAYGLTDDRIWHARTEVPAELVRSTVGCGDAFLAGFLAAHQQEQAVDRALAHATAVAAASAMSDLPASFAEQDRLDLLARVQIQEV